MRRLIGSTLSLFAFLSLPGWAGVVIYAPPTTSTGVGVCPLINKVVSPVDTRVRVTVNVAPHDMLMRVTRFVYDQYELDGLFTREEIEVLRQEDAARPMKDVFYVVRVNDADPDSIDGVMRILVGSPSDILRSGLPAIEHFVGDPEIHDAVQRIALDGKVPVEFGRLATRWPQRGRHRSGFMFEMLNAGLGFLTGLIQKDVVIVAYANKPENRSLYEKLGMSVKLDRGKDVLMSGSLELMNGVFGDRYTQPGADLPANDAGYQAALARLDGAMPLGRVFPPYLQARAGIHLQFGRIGEAFKDVERLEEVIPGSVDVYEDLLLPIAPRHAFDWLSEDPGHWRAGIAEIERLREDRRYRRLTVASRWKLDMNEVLIYLIGRQWGLVDAKIKDLVGRSSEIEGGSREAYYRIDQADGTVDFVATSGIVEAVKAVAQDSSLAHLALASIGRPQGDWSDLRPERFIALASLLREVGRTELAESYRHAAEFLRRRDGNDVSTGM